MIPSLDRRVTKLEQARPRSWDGELAERAAVNLNRSEMRELCAVLENSLDGVGWETLSADELETLSRLTVKMDAAELQPSGPLMAPGSPLDGI